MYVCYRRNGTCENVWSRRVRVRLNLKMITLLKQINYTLVWTLCDTTRAAQQHPVFDGWCIQHCSTSWIVFDRVAVAAGRMVSAAIIFCTFISLHIQNFHAAGIQLRFFLHSFHLHLLPCMKYWIALHVYRRQMYTICLTHSEHGRPRWIALNCTSMHDWRAHGHQMTNAMFCENKKKKEEEIIAQRDKETTGPQLRVEPTNDWWFNKYLPLFIQTWFYSQQRNNNRGTETTTTTIVTIF